MLGDWAQEVEHIAHLHSTTLQQRSLSGDNSNPKARIETSFKRLRLSDEWQPPWAIKDGRVAAC